MAFRTWLLRLAILAVIGVAVAAVWRAQSIVSPDAVRDGLVTALGDQFADVEVHVESARIRVFGGIQVRDLRLTRPGDGEPFFAAPTAVIYPDKEQLNNGRRLVRKIEVDGPTLRVERRADGTWNLAGLVADAGPADRPLPTFVVTGATVYLIDRTGALPPITLTDAKLTLINDPRPILKADGQATVRVKSPDGAEVAARATVSLRVNRTTGQLHITADVPPVPLTADVVKIVAAAYPPAAELGTLTGRIGAKADIAFRPGAAPKYDIRGTLADGRFEDARLPWPVEKLAATVAVADGVLTVESASATCGPATADVSLKTRPVTTPPPAGDLLAAAEHRLERLTVSVRDLPVDAALFDRLPAGVRRVQKLFAPAGPVQVAYTLTRPAAGGWVRQIDLRPNRMRLEYEKFRYPLDGVGGLIRKTITSAGGHDTTVDLTGVAAGRPITITGRVTGDGADPGIALKVAGTGVPIDDALFNAIPNPKVSTALRDLRAGGRGDFVVDVFQPKDVNRCDTTFRIQVTDGRVNYARFPYPLESVRGRITVAMSLSDTTRPVYPDRPDPPPPADRVELTGFEARHGPGTITLYGVDDPIPGTADRQLTLKVWGKDCPVDADLRTALGELKLESVWRTFSPRGAVTFGVQVTILDRATVPLPTDGPRAGRRGPAADLMSRRKVLDPPFDPTADLTMALNFRGPSVTPDFFAVPLDDLAGQVWYDGKRVKLARFAARRGAETWSLAGGEVVLYPNGQVFADLGGLSVAPIAVDAEMRAAVPGKLKDALAAINLRGPAELTVEKLVALTPPDPPRPLPPLSVARAQSTESFPKKPAPDAPAGGSPDPDVYWKGELKLVGAAADTGVTWDAVHGRIACEGRYFGTHLGEVAGHVWFDRAMLADHPLAKVSAAFRCPPQVPDPAKPGDYLPSAVSFPDLTGTLFGGNVGGEARVVLAEPVRYTLGLTATDVRLEEVARFHNLGNGAKLAGLAQARLELASGPDPATGKDTLTGGGSADVLNGHILNLKWLLPLLKTLKLQAPDKTAFDEAHATFTVKGDRIKVTHLDLLGDAVSLGGSGELTMAGEDVRFELYTIWSQTLQRWLTTPFGDVTAFVSEKLFKIEVTQKNGELKYEPRVVPFVTDPFRAVAERLKRPPTARAAPGR